MKRLPLLDAKGNVIGHAMLSEDNKVCQATTYSVDDIDAISGGLSGLSVGAYAVWVTD